MHDGAASLSADAGEAFLWSGRIVEYKQPLKYVELARAIPEARFWMLAVLDPASVELAVKLRSAAAQTPNLELLEPRPHGEAMELVRRSVRSHHSRSSVCPTVPEQGARRSGVPVFDATGYRRAWPSVSSPAVPGSGSDGCARTWMGAGRDKVAERVKAMGAPRPACGRDALERAPRQLV